MQSSEYKQKIIANCQSHHEGNPPTSGKETHKHKRIWEIVLGLRGWQQFVYVFFRGHALWVKKHTHTENPQNLRKSRDKFLIPRFVFVFVSSVVSVTPNYYPTHPFRRPEETTHVFALPPLGVVGLRG